MGLMAFWNSEINFFFYYHLYILYVHAESSQRAYDCLRIDGLVSWFDCFSLVYY